METPGDPESQAAGPTLSLNPSKTQTLESPGKTLITDPSPAGAGGTQKSGVPGLGFPVEISDFVCTDDVKDPPAVETLGEVAVDNTSSVDVLEAVVVESSSCTSVLGLGLGFEFAPNGSEASVQGGHQGGGAKEKGMNSVGGGGGGENPFVVGDIVWGKVKNQPWWPGQVYDSSDASEHAKKSRPKDRRYRLLVAYFGDGAFAWNDPNQLKPLEEDFGKMVAQSSSKNFVLAVKEALNEMRRSWESQMTCHCVPAEVRNKLVRPHVLNSGIKDGVTVPECKIKDPAIAEKESSEIIRRIHDIACDVSFADMLEVTILKSWFSAFNCSSGRRVHDHPHGIVDLNEKSSNSAAPFMGFDEEEAGEDWLSSTPITGSGPLKGPDMLEAKLNERKKQRSMAQLIAEMDMEMEDSIDEKDEVVVILDKPASPIQKGNKKGENKGLNSEFGDAFVGEEEETGSGKRERKKSKYLSPPYTMLGGSIKRSTLGKDADVELPKKDFEASQVRESVGKTVGRPPNSSRILKCNGWASQDQFRELGASVNELLLEFHATALCSMHLKRSPFSSGVRDFFARFRSSVYNNGSDSEDYKKSLNNSQGEDRMTPCIEINGTSESKGQTSLERQSLCHEADGSEEGKSGSGLKGKSKRNETNGFEEGKSGAGLKGKSKGNETNGFEEGKSGAGLKGKSKGKSGAGIKGKSLDHDTIAFEEPMSMANVKGKSVRGSVEIKSGSSIKGKSKGNETNGSEDIISGGSIKGKYVDHDTIACEGPMSVANVKGKPVGNATNGPEEGKPKQKRKRKKDGSEETTPTDSSKGKSVANVTGGSEEGKSGQKRKRKKNGCEEAMPTPISKGKSVGNETNGSEEGKSVVNVTGGSEEGKSVANVTGGSEEGKSGQKRKRKNNGSEEAMPMPVAKGKSVGNETNGSEEGKSEQKRKRRRKKKNDDEANCETAAALLLTFSPGASLPSKEDLIFTFRKFGELCELETEPLKDSGCARVLFAKSSDAEKAFKSSEKNGAFWPTVINSRVRYLPGNLNTPTPPPPPPPNLPKPPLQFVRKNLERMRKNLEMMISSLSAKDTGSSDGLKPEARDNSYLVDEMNGLLMKVNILLTGCSPVTNT